MLRFDFSDEHGIQRRIEFANPLRTIVARRLNDVRPAMRAVDEALTDGLHVAGLVCYEAAPAFDPALRVKGQSELPLVWFGVFAAPSEIASSDIHLEHQASLDSTQWTPDMQVDDYDQAIASVREAIARGDLYQANYTFRLNSTLTPASLEARYRQLLAEHRAPYAAYLDLGRWRILSLSPELFFRRRGNDIVTKPMKGTAPRGLWLDDDLASASRLASSKKDRAENVMIVDLMRNDLGRIAEIGSVQVRSLFDVERYPSVFQMTSSIDARLRPNTTLDEIFAALFPAGSITGAPKTSSMALLSRLERSARGPYCGAIGFASPDGHAVFNVAIRTAVVDSQTGHATFGIGGGVTWDSTVSGEYAEALSKAACLDATPPFDLLETMRLEGGQYARLEGHLRRLRDSAAYFDFGFDAARVTAALDAHAAQHPEETRRVRLLLARDGGLVVESRSLESLPESPRTFALANTPIERTDRFLYHKTTRREVYERHRAVHPDAFDVLLWNAAGELTEFTVGNLVVEIDGQRWTPPRRCGLLGGVLRQALLDSGEIRERVLTRDHLASATAIWRVSSLRGWVTLEAEYLSAGRSLRGNRARDPRTGS
jgi:para-aminobenzoate synthetase / 4-amino-4-deoxychorismate lyase